MDPLTLFGLVAMTLMRVTCALGSSSRWYVAAFALACARGSAYGFPQGARPFGPVVAIRSLVVLHRFARLPA